MPKEIIDYLETQNICVLAVEMLDGSPHSATLHFANTDKPIFIFKTSREYRKSEPLFGREKTRASVVVGVDESNMKTLQMDGTAELLKDDSLKEIYFSKFPGKAAKSDGVYFIFEPTWWRFTDYTGPTGKTILLSDSPSL